MKSNHNKKLMARIPAIPAETLTECAYCEYFRDWEESVILLDYYRPAEPAECLRTHREVIDKRLIPEWCPFIIAQTKNSKNNRNVKK